MGRPILAELRSPVITQASLRIEPLPLGAAYFKTDLIVGRVPLSISAAGSPILFHLAQRLYGAAGQILGITMCAPAVPLLSPLHKLGDLEGFRRDNFSELMQPLLISALALSLVLAIGCQRRLKTDPLSAPVAEVKLTPRTG